MKNEYTRKKVSAKDRKACLICGNPTVTVLFNGSGPDWFYTCDIHLADNPQFVQPLYPKEYHESLASLKPLKERIEELQRKERGTWDQWVNKIFDSKKPSSSDDKKEDRDDASSDDKKKTDEANSLEELKQTYQATLDKLAASRETCNKYTLHDLVFQSRVDRLRKLAQLKEKKRVEQQSYTNTDPNQLLQSFSFPEVPKNTVNKS
ncbi:Vfa1 [Kluyveromyces lactis]|nr:Vfa1 [Kluyveromyces lactis]